MIRRIVIIRSHEYLQASFAKKSGGPAKAGLSKTVGAVKGATMTEQRPAPLPRPRTGFGIAAKKAGPEAQPYAVSMTFEDEDAVLRLQKDQEKEVLGVYADLPIRTTAYCGDGAIGTARGVKHRLSTTRLHKSGLDGRGARIAIVDTGISAKKGPLPIPNVVHGWHPSKESYVGGTAAPDHGTMCAFDAQLVAPKAKILDYALLLSNHDGLGAWLSDAILAYADILARRGEEPGPLVVSNSWAVFDTESDEPRGSPGNYAANLAHPFNEMVTTLVQSGVDVVFCAGNCGKECPDGRCAKDVGPGKSIHGANGHPDVLTVAGVTYHHERVGYSSQGPAVLSSQKPDVAAYTHFVGSLIDPVDTGTSAACPVAAGVVAALRSRAKTQTPAQIKAAIQRTARDVNGGGFDHDIGFGVIRPLDAARALGLKVM